MAQHPRGIDPELLVSQIRNTMPYLWEEEGKSIVEHFPPAQTVLSFKPESELSHFEYFRLCLSAHYLTCGTPVPTDVDNQIRLKLWPRNLDTESALQMADLVLESRSYDFTRVTTRYVFPPEGVKHYGDIPLSGHRGEWFTLATGAYCALGQYSATGPAKAKQDELFSAIDDEVNRHSEVFGSLWRVKDGLGSLKASASIAHNFGDLDRVMDMWELSAADRLRLRFYKLTSLPFDSDRNLRYLGRLWVAGELYKSKIEGDSMALENHRHFALRKPKCLRKSPKLLVPTGPFFDSWGRITAEILEPEEKTEVAEALVQGWSRLKNTVGYGRALRGMLEVDSDIDLSALSKTSRAILDVSADAFEKKWADEALILMDDIPSRA